MKRLDDERLDELLGRARQAVDRRAEEAGADAAWAMVQERLREPRLRALEERLRRLDRGSRPRLASRLDLLVLLLGEGRDGVAGVTRLMKLAFLASKELGWQRLVRDPYRFQPYRLGPFTSEVYDDLELLERAGVVRRETVDEEGLTVIQRDEQVARDVAALNHGLAETERINALATRYRLSARGRRFCRALARSAQRRDPRLLPGLELVRAEFGRLPLRALLRHIYRRWPEYTTESLVRDRVLGPR